LNNQSFFLAIDIHFKHESSSSFYSFLVSNLDSVSLELLQRVFTIKLIFCEIFYKMVFKRVDWSPSKRSKAITLRQEGYTYQEIALKLGAGATKSGIRKVCERYKVTNSTKNAKKSGRKKKFSAQDERQLCRLALKDRRMSSKRLQQAMKASGVEMSDRTVRQKLCENGLKARRPRKKPFLNETQRKKRLMWALQHKDWMCDDWAKVIWSDETRISIFGSDGVKFVRRRPGEDMLPACLTATMKHPISIMVWACMSRDGVGRLHIVDGTINAKKYQTDILEPKLLPSIEDLFPGRTEECIFQQDSAPCHTAKTSMKWLKDNSIKVLPWPGNSPDLNPIENLWSRLKIIVSNESPSNKRELIEAVLKGWFKVITPGDLRRLVDSMPRRIEEVIKNKGFPTKY
jgi:transposase